MKRWRFNIGQAFPHDKPIALWLASLSIATNDLVLSNVRMSEAFARDGESPSPEGIYFVRLSASHFREAVKILTGAESDPDVKAFIESLPDDALADYRQLHEAFHPRRGSFVEQFAKPLRDRFLHYPSLKEDQAGLIKALHDLASVDSGITLGTEHNLANLRFDFADEIASNWGIGAVVAGDQTQLAMQMGHLAELTNALLRFLQYALAEYINRLPEGTVDLHES
jgi:hypothetical protein